MIELTNENGKKITMSADHITIVTELTDSGCFVSTVDSGLTVKESRKEVVRKIMEYKLAMVRYKALASDWAANDGPRCDSRFKLMTQDFDLLKELAGLDGDPDAQ